MTTFKPGGSYNVADGCSRTTISSVDFSLYRALTFSFEAKIQQNHAWNTASVNVSCGGASVSLVSDSSDGTSEDGNTKTSGTKTLTFTQTSGTGACTTHISGTGHVTNPEATYSNAKLLGRTTVG